MPVLPLHLKKELSVLLIMECIKNCNVHDAGSPRVSAWHLPMWRQPRHIDSIRALAPNFPSQSVGNCENFDHQSLMSEGEARASVQLLVYKTTHGTIKQTTRLKKIHIMYEGVE